MLNPELRPLARFSYSAKTWELPLTDFTVCSEVRRTGKPGTYSLDELGFETPRRVALLLSLATNHNDWHSKLAAGVLRFP